MENFTGKEYRVFEMFDKQWAIVTAGSIDHFANSAANTGFCNPQKMLPNVSGHLAHAVKELPVPVK